jgi:septal ring factor EnvC (AmiA/AmiB activator)
MKHIKLFEQFINEDLDFAFKPNDDKDFTKDDLKHQDISKEKELEVNFKKSFELYKEDTDNIQLKIYTLIQLASWLLSKTSQLESNQISDEIDYLTSLVELIEKDKSNIEKNIDKIKKSYSKVYNELINNKKTSEDFSKYQKDLQIK